MFLIRRSEKALQTKKEIFDEGHTERIFSEMIRIWVRKSELQARKLELQTKVGDTAGQTPKIRTESPRKGPRMGLGASTENPP